MPAKTETKNLPVTVEPEREPAEREPYTPDETLLDMLTYMRPHASRSENRFSRKFLDPLGVSIDGFGNRYIRIGTAPVLWSSHVDSVHSKGGRQDIEYDDNGIISLAPKEKASCLGGDDASGVWLMTQMIKRGVEGLYIFHRGEECGGLGSSFISNRTPAMLEGIQYGIALDRNGYGDVITHMGARVCSDEFAEDLAKSLSGTATDGSPVIYMPTDTGLFTDTDNYRHLIPECTNLSVGYFQAHSSREEVDSEFLEILLEKLCVTDVTALPVIRDHTEPDEWDYYSHWNNYPGIASASKDRAANDSKYSNNYGRVEKGDRDLYMEEIADYESQELAEMAMIVGRHPDSVAKLMLEYGVTPDELRQAVYDYTGEVDSHSRLESLGYE